MTIKSRINKLEEKCSVAEIPQEDMIRVVSGMTPDEIEALQTKLERKYGPAVDRIIFLNTGIIRPGRGGRYRDGCEDNK